MKRIMTILAVVLIFSVLADADITVLQHLSFDEISGTSAANSGTGAAATLQGGASLNATGVFGSGVSLTTGQIPGQTIVRGWVDVNQNIIDFADTSFTMAGWFKLNYQPWYGSHMACEYDCPDLKYPFGFNILHDSNTSNNHIAVKMLGGAFETGPVTMADFVGNTHIAAGTWYHWGITWDREAGTTCLYVNGELDGTQTTESPARLASYWGQFGDKYWLGKERAAGDSDATFDGLMDEHWLISGAALDKTQVNSLMTTNTIPEPATMVLLGLGGLGALIRRKK